MPEDIKSEIRNSKSEIHDENCSPALKSEIRNSKSEIPNPTQDRKFEIRNSQSEIRKAWYAIRTRSRYEKMVNEQLTSRGVEAFLPLVDRRRRWKDRWKDVSFPLFPGYCFARFQYENRLAVLTAVGVVQILGINGHSTPVPDHEIEAVRQLVTSTLPFDPHPYLKEGMEVEVIRGPLSGIRGTMVRKGTRARLVVAIHLIQQAASVELDAADVRPVG